jgi:aminoglycoside 6'-N-acetyltransferase
VCGVTTVALRPFTRADFPLMSAWLAAPHVARWWADDGAPQALERQYGASLDGRDRAQLRIVLADTVPVGFLQWYPLDGEPDYTQELETVLPIEPGDASLDYLVGEQGLLGTGIGSAAIRAACAEVWQVPELGRLVVPVHADNVASRRTLLRAGFTEIAEGELEPDNPIDDRRHVIHELRRPLSSAQPPAG